MKEPPRPRAHEIIEGQQRTVDAMGKVVPVEEDVVWIVAIFVPVSLPIGQGGEYRAGVTYICGEPYEEVELAAFAPVNQGILVIFNHGEIE